MGSSGSRSCVKKPPRSSRRAKREEVMRHRKEISVELVHLREDLASSAAACERLQKEKEEARAAELREREEHQAELTQLEERLRSFYSAEWDKVHQVYQEEADKYKAVLQEQVEELRAKQEALRTQQEVQHVEQMVAFKQQYEASIEEFRRKHDLEVQTLSKTLKDTESSLSEKIQALNTENSSLSDKIRAEEERRKIMAEKSQKDSHTLYLEQELESLKVVLELKTKHLHEQDKKLMQMDKLIESNVKLEESLTKVQQENEDFRARMDKHAALSRQLSSEQAMLQQNLQKESKVNKRLSMENEELLWKLHNGDTNSPRRLSPSSPRNSASFPSSASYPGTFITPR